jgi:hypothetical protein
MFSEWGRRKQTITPVTAVASAVSDASCVCVCVCVCVCLCVCMCASANVCMCACVTLPVCHHWKPSVCVCVCVCVCSLYVCVCVCVRGAYCYWDIVALVLEVGRGCQEYCCACGSLCLKNTRHYCSRQCMCSFAQLWLLVAAEGGCPDVYPTGPHTCWAARSRSDLQQLCHAEYTTELWMTQLKANTGPSTVTSLGGGDVWKYIDPSPANVRPSESDEVSCLPEPHKPAPITKCNLFECYCSQSSSYLEAEAQATLNATRKTDATPKLVGRGYNFA